MPVFHSSFNEEKVPELCGMAFLPLKKGPRGPAGAAPDDKDDVVDEAINMFRANVLFANYQPEGAADRLIIYLTLFIHKVLTECKKKKTKRDAQSHLFSLGKKTPTLPGDAKWPLGRMYPTPANSSEKERTSKYIMQCRQHVIERLLDRIYLEDGTPNKHWMMFAKRKFMGKVLK